MRARWTPLRAAMWVVVAVFVWRAVIVIPHTHWDSGFQAKCPACHTDRAVSQAAAIALAADLVSAPILVGFLPPAPPAVLPVETVERELPARGPPPTA